MSAIATETPLVVEFPDPLTPEALDEQLSQLPRDERARDVIVHHWGQVEVTSRRQRLACLRQVMHCVRAAAGEGSVALVIGGHQRKRVAAGFCESLEALLSRMLRDSGSSFRVFDNTPAAFQWVGARRWLINQARKAVSV